MNGLVDIFLVVACFLSPILSKYLMYRYALHNMTWTNDSTVPEVVGGCVMNADKSRLDKLLNDKGLNGSSSRRECPQSPHFLTYYQLITT